MKRYILFTLFLVLGSMPAFSQILEPVKWTFEQKQVSDSVYDLTFKASIDQGWHLYSTDLPAGGPVKTSINIKPGDGFELDGKPDAKSPVIKKFDQTFQMELEYYAHEAVFVQRVKLLTNKPLEINGSVEFMSCNDETCLPPTEKDFSFSFNGGGEKGAVAVPAAEKTTPGGPIGPVGTQHHGLGWFFLFSFLAGLAAILTPCVFPMIPMTVSFFMHSSESRVKAKMQALVYGLSIIVIYTLIGTIVAVTLGPGFANWLSTHWLPNILFFIIFLVFAFSFFGAFEIVLPSSWVNRSDRKADRGGFGGSFFMALTLVLVSFSCTGPIVGAILVESAGGMILKPVIGMFGFALAFALPFTLFAFFPQWLSNLPKSGGWLNSVKVVLGFLELALGLKFLSIADQTYHWGILDREVYLAFWIVIFALLGFYLLGKLKFAHDSDVPHVTVPRLLLSIITFSFVVYLVPGMFGAPLKAISGYLPPMATHDFDLHKIIRDEVKLVNSTSGTYDFKKGESALCEKPKYSGFLELPHGLQGYFDYDQGMACAKEQHKPVFIDFTGHGCVNCREMEANVWSDPRVLGRLENDYVIIALYVDDKTKLPEEDWVKSTYDGKIKKTLGRKYADFQISRFGVNAQPYYVLLDNSGKMLTQPTARDLNPDHFVDFLDKGLAEYQKRNEE
jgi:thiol:disulfide interchange protein DsbD